jgi:hypothetical protein
MTDIEAVRGEARRSRPGPEVLAVLLAVVLYGALLVISMPSTASETSVPPPSAAIATTSPRPSTDPLRPDILSLLEIDGRLIANRATLQTLLKARALDTNATARVLVDVSQTATLGSDRASELALDDAASVVGGRLEVIYASADRTSQDALDAALGNVEAYQLAARSLVDQLGDLPAIDKELKALLGQAAASPSVVPSGSPSPSPSPTASAPASASPSPSVPPSSPSAGPGGAGRVVDLPGEMLRDRSFEQGATQWELVADPPAIVQAATDKPLVGTGKASLRLDLSVPSDPGAGVRIGQVVSLAATDKYVANLVMRASSERSVRIRVVGPNAELHAVQTVEIGPEAAAVSVPLTALIDDPAAHLWIEFPGAWSGSVWLDDASMTLAPAS